MIASEQEMRQLIKQMDNKYGFPQAFGCLNGTHILISHPPDFFVTTGNIQSINIQAVCNWKGIFLHVNFIRSETLRIRRIMAFTTLTYMEL